MLPRVFERWIRRRSRDEEIDREIAAHLAMATDERVAEGQDRVSARQAALKEFGNVILTREATAKTWTGGWMEQAAALSRDVRYAVRLLLRSPGYSLTVVAVLALGIGTNLVALGFYKALALTPLAGVTASSELLFITAQTNGGRSVPLSYHDYRYLRDHLDAYESLAASHFNGYSIGRGASAQRVYGEIVTGNYFEVLGVRAQHGRTLLRSDDVVRSGHPVTVISDSLWRRMFGADPGIVGRTIDVNTVPLTVVGIADAGFHGSVVGIDIELFVPIMMQPVLSGGWDALDLPRAQLVFGLGRPRDGITLDAARTEARLVGSRLAAEHPDEALQERAVVLPIQESPLGLQTYTVPLLGLLVATTLLLLIVVCANVAGLVLVRTLSRRGEIAARLALGASRGRIARLLLIENLLLAIPGGALAYWVPHLAEPSLLAARGTIAVRLHFNSEGALVVAAAVLLAGVSAALCGLFPAVNASRFDLASTLRDTLSPRGPAAGRLRILLVVSQVATSVVLLVGTALMLRTVDAARGADPGFDPRHVASVHVDLRPAGYGPEDGLVFYERLRADLRRSLDGVESVSLMRIPLLMVFDFGVREFTVEGDPRGGDETSQFPFNIVSPDHFRTLMIPLLAGRDFDQRDDVSSAAVTIVNETFARRFWGSPDAAIGRRVRTADWRSGVPEWMRVVGVARDIKYARLNEEPTPYVYLPFAQAYGANMLVHVRGVADTPTLVERVRQRIAMLDPNVPILEARPLAEQTALGTSIYEVAASVLGFVGIAALVLSALGIYGLVAYTVRQSSHEIGIRVAVGAPRTHILWRFLRRGLRLGVAGVAGGAALSLATSRVLSSLLFGVRPTDTPTLVAVAGTIVLVAAIACALPAWRASRLDPNVVLRDD